MTISENAPKIIRVDTELISSGGFTHQRGCYGFFYCTSGKMRLGVGVHTWDVACGEIVVWQPSTSVAVVSCSDDISGVLCMADSGFVLSAIRNLSVNEHLLFIASHPIINPTAKDCEELEMQLTLCWRSLADSDRPLGKDIVDALARAIVFTVLSVYYEQTSSVPGNRTRSESILIEFEHDLQLFVTQHRDVAFYARRRLITSHYLCGVVRSLTGKSVRARITEAVITEAMVRLRDPDRSVKQIAFDLGFPSQTFFCRYFKRATGMTPTQYRRAR